MLGAILGDWEQFVATIVWEDSPSACTALIDGVPVCALKLKDIGGWTASWMDDRKWPPPAHLPKAQPQDTKFFPGKADAKAAVEQVLSG